MFGGGKETEWGYRTGGREVWRGSKAQAEADVKRINKRKPGTAKLIQRQVPKAAKTKVGSKIQDKRDGRCTGGKCKGPYTCRKHMKQISGSEFELYDQAGRNKNTTRWDE